MVLRQVSPQWGLWIALAALPLMALLLLDQPIGVAAALAGAVVLLGFYHVAGKTKPIPYLADFVQGAGWAALTFVGAGVGGRANAATLVGGWLRRCSSGHGQRRPRRGA
jgi:4-hydroxybenzoate polyprenyltransferase